MAKKKQPSSKGAFRSFLLFLLVFVGIAAVLSLSNPLSQKPEEVGVGDIADKVKNGEVAEIVVRGGSQLEVTLNNEEQTKLQSNKEISESLPTLLATYGVTAEDLQKTNIKVERTSGWKYFLINVLPIVLPLIFIVAFFWLMMRQVQGTNNRAMTFGQSQAKTMDPNKKNKTTFADVAGAEEAKEELEEIVEFLKTPKKFTSLGAKIPRGVLLMGPPGTGKTLLARAVAGEANAPFFHISGSEFVEMFVGVGASRVRDFFKKAKKAAPAILFIDEIDAVGRQRGTGMGGSHDEREQTLNQILTEMDGFENEDNVIVIAATNRADVLDPALLRPGRFDRRVIIDLPNVKEREAILKVHAKNKILATGVSLKRLAQRTTGFSGADLMNLLNEAAIFAARTNKRKISLEDCLEAIDKVLLGPQRRSARMSDEEKEITAYHEGGHALVAYLTKASDSVHKVTIIPRGRAGGYTLKLPEDDRKLHSKKMLLADIAVSLGGHAAESLQYEDITTGASNDLQKATKVARALITQYGMSEKLGPRTFGEVSDMIFLGREIHEQRDYSEHMAQEIDKEMERIIDEQYKYVEALLKDNKDKLDLIAKALMIKETLEKEEFEQLLETGVLPEEEPVEKVEDKTEKAAEPASEEINADKK
ncbi:MAG: cell division protein FtsH [Candidatus Kerfeldbacteria bacterium CG15_BIG_FIL_POST_REV_8_21_14_020_45_12]|uniref:ATP-dependent zinc metalloprotease FtsH n=1 Tax=Candidatus Kerfeldbacteria bacterium CG15_BIG_FIL_POST_REV_8_21_14_020_45_12 TaxID=2014247 RepID=A0A2M7H588_9BACT|nr:MAG: cell division protein FtsH [Candidatus Kerfeldbacteria bacterium CG15_BIG_FIL_POST_REV_8_21_14_020_45_12]PJA93956.1 MAG: cell division protein FtsH [Candidatus Kerfeldbacteria bacterium CG_4_9_14_3_um_filter_45_8]